MSLPVVPRPWDHLQVETWAPDMVGHSSSFPQHIRQKCSQCVSGNEALYRQKASLAGADTIGYDKRGTLEEAKKDSSKRCCKKSVIGTSGKKRRFKNKKRHWYKRILLDMTKEALHKKPKKTLQRGAAKKASLVQAEKRGASKTKSVIGTSGYDWI